MENTNLTEQEIKKILCEKTDNLKITALAVLQLMLNSNDSNTRIKAVEIILNQP